ncbi:MAG: DNA internalization-related competence protein ComEC/Rec2 [Terriglobales bacterium]
MQPLLYAALALAAGIVAAASGTGTLAPLGIVWALGTVCGVAAVAAVLAGRRRGAAVLGLALCAAVGYGRGLRALQPPARLGALVAAAQELQQQPRARRFLTGYARDRPALLYDHGQPSAVRLDLEATSLALSLSSPDVRPVHGGVRLYAYPPASGGGGWDAALLHLPAGAGLAVSVHLRPLRRYNDPGVPDFSAAARRQGIVVTATLPLAGWQSWPMARHASPLTSARARLWGWLSARLDALVPPARAARANALLRGMLLGDVARLDETTRTDFQIDGVYHLLVVAGLHIGVLWVMLEWLFRRLRLPRLTARGASLAVLAVYAWTIAGRTPTERALFMLAIYFGAEFWYRQRQALNAVGAAALLLLLWHPLDLYLTGFQLSFAAALLLAGVCLPLLAASSRGWRAMSRHPAWRAALYLYDVILISLVLQLGLAPFNTVDFHRANPWTVVANAVLVPGAGVLIPLGWLGVLTASLGAHAAQVAGWVLGGSAQGMLAFAAWMARWPGAGWRTPSPPGWFLAASGAAAVGWIIACTAGLPRGHAWRNGALAGAAMLALALTLAAAPFPPRLPQGLSATILDVGQGDSILVAFPDHRTMLVDGGPRSGRWDTGEQIVAPYLWSLGLHRLGAVLLTHAHNDHLGGLSTVVKNFHPREVWLTRTLPVDAPTRAFLRLIATSGARVRRLAAGDALRVGASRLAVLLPAPDYHAGPAPSNDDSMVVRVSYNGEAMLLEGDAEAVGEHWLVDHHAMLASAVLKVGHHGSKTSSTPQFLAAVHPLAAVISVGADNSYGQPAAAVLAGLRQAGARVFRTDRDGAVECRLQNGTLRVYLFRPVPRQRVERHPLY